MAVFKAKAPGVVVSGVGEGGERLPPFIADAKGVIEVPDDFQEAITCLLGARDIEPYVAPAPDPNAVSEPKPKPKKAS